MTLRTCFLATSILLISFLDVLGQIEEEVPRNSLFYYSGFFDSSQKLEFNLQVDGYSVSGSFIMVSSGELFVFNGRMASDKSGMGVLVYDNNNQFVASLEAKLISDQTNFAKEIRGVWKPVNDKRHKNIDLKKIAELADIDILNPDPLQGE